jgi:hypothetical protein
MKWRLVDLELDTGDVMSARFELGAFFVEVVAFVAIEGRSVLLTRCDVDGSGAGTVGIGQLRAIVRLVMEALDVDEVRIDGTARTTGARPGRVPTPLVFRRG